MTRLLRLVAIFAALTLVVAACGDDGDDGGDDDPTTDDTADGDEGDDDGGDGGDDDADDDSGDDAAAPAGGGDAGTLVLGDETIELDSARCFLEEQEAAAGGGTIEFVIQAFGANAAGEELVLDVSRYSEESQFAGDDVKVDFGDPFSEDAYSYSSVSPIGTVNLDGSTASADALVFQDDELNEIPGSFTVNC